jgi:hypothetical protein
MALSLWPVAESVKAATWYSRTVLGPPPISGIWLLATHSVHIVSSDARPWTPMARSRSRSPASAPPSHAAAGPGSLTDAQRLGLMAASAALLAWPGVPGGTPSAAFPYLYLATLQHALRGAALEARPVLALWLMTFAAMLFGLRGFLPVSGPGYVALTAVLTFFPILPLVLEAAIANKLWGGVRAGPAVWCAVANTEGAITHRVRVHRGGGGSSSMHSACAPPLLSTLLLPCVCVAVDFVWTSGMLYGSYGLFAYSQYGLLPLMQVASVFGIYGVSFVISWSASLVCWLLCTPQPAGALRRGVRTLATLWATVLLFGGARLSLLAPPAGAQVVHVAALSAVSDARTPRPHLSFVTLYVLPPNGPYPGRIRGDRGGGSCGRKQPPTPQLTDRGCVRAACALRPSPAQHAGHPQHAAAPSPRFVALPAPPLRPRPRPRPSCLSAFARLLPRLSIKRHVRRRRNRQDGARPLRWLDRVAACAGALRGGPCVGAQGAADWCGGTALRAPSPAHPPGL